MLCYIQRLEEEEGYLDETSRPEWDNLVKDISVLHGHKVERKSHSEVANWLLSASEMEDKEPKVSIDTLGIHLVDQGYGTALCMTFREISHLKHNENANKMDSKSATTLSLGGVIGQIVSSVRLKILKVSM